MPQPLIPRSKTNPVGQADKIRRARDAVFADIDKAQQDALDAWAALPVARQNGRVLNRAFYEYLIDLPALKNIVDAIATTLRRGTGRTVMQAQVEAAYRSGVGMASANLSRLIDDYTRSVTAVLSDYQVMRRAALAGARVYEFMDGFAGDTAADLARIMFQAVQDGQNPHDVARVIRQRFSVSKVRAERIARTEITGALRRGRWDESKDAEEKFGLEVRLIHVSALIPERTRPSHAARHGRIYTREEEADWYSKDGNGINCLCSTSEVTFKDGKPIFGEKLLARMADARKRFVG